jgi:hypothetical protein
MSQIFSRASKLTPILETHFNVSLNIFKTKIDITSLSKALNVSYILETIDIFWYYDIR